jgi:hypothetical protein
LPGVPFLIGVASTAYLVHLALAYLPSVMRSFPGPSPEHRGPSSSPQTFRIQPATLSEEP